MTGSPTSVRRRAHRSRWIALYGARPWHLLVLLACFALTGYAVSRLVGNAALVPIVVWFIGSALAWDLLVGPAYALGDRLLEPLQRLSRGGVPVRNHVRVPALLSSLLLLIWAPLVFQRSEAIYRAKSGLTQDDYLDRWLAVTALLFLGSALLWWLRARRAGSSALRVPAAEDGDGAPAGRR